MDRRIKKGILLDGNVSKRLKKRILETLINGAQGMFRWVEMSLETLSRIKFQPDFDYALGRLPVKLSGLYDIIYTQIDQTQTYGRDVAIKTLKWLLCAQRLLSVEEFLAAVDVVDDSSSSESGEDDGHGQADSLENNVLRLCRNLVILDSKQRNFRFAHQSVREYLLAKSEYTVIEQHALATERCLNVYLNELSPGSGVPTSVQQNDILKDYAEVYWPVHYKYIEEDEFHETQKKVSNFLMEGSRTSPFYMKWVLGIQSKYGGFHGYDLNLALGLDWIDCLGYKILYATSTPETHLSVACAFGFSKILKYHELSIIELNQRRKVEGYEYTFLLIAAEEGHDQLIRLLLDRGAEVNAQGGLYGNALQAASRGGHEQTVQILLDRGAKINAQGGKYDSALQAASRGGHEKVIQVLLDRGAKINAQGGHYGNALQAASLYGNENIVQVLLDRGAKINVQGGHYGNALQAASLHGHEQIVQVLLDRGAKINAQGGWYDNALQAASSEGHEQIVQVLLDRGAEINAQGGWYGNALQAASSHGHEQTVQILLDRGAKINAQDGKYDNALQAASTHDHEQTVQRSRGEGERSRWRIWQRTAGGIIGRPRESDTGPARSRGEGERSR